MSQPFSYDLVDYPSQLQAQLHISRLAAIGKLHGIPTTSPKCSRVLEIGCGDALQLISLALAYPSSEFIGIDLSAKAIARGERMRSRLGLDNLLLVATDLTDWDPPKAASFDYVIAHGFYSWVPESVRERLMELCGTALSPSGIACISYNTLPGCHLRRMLWDIMRFHAGADTPPSVRVERALECLGLLESGMQAGRRYTDTMAGEIRDLRERLHAGVLFHDDLAEINDPCTLDDFIRHARTKELEFVAEASYHEMSTTHVSSDAKPLLDEIAKNDVVTKEQYLDFLTGRRFRQTLLCRRDANPEPIASAAALVGMHVISRLQEDESGPDDDQKLRFMHPVSGHLTTDDASLQHMLGICEAHQPSPQLLEDLIAGCREHQTADSADDRLSERAMAFILRAYQAGLIDLQCDPPEFSEALPSRPTASPLARLQIASGCDLITNLQPASVRMEGNVAKALLVLIDGSRDHEELLLALAERMAASSTGVADAATPLGDTEEWITALRPELEANLLEIARKALLMPNRARDIA